MNPLSHDYTTVNINNICSDKKNDECDIINRLLRGGHSNS